MKKINHLGRKVLIGVIILIFIIVAVFYGMFHKEIATINTIAKIDDNTLYTMEYKGDYGFDDFLTTGANNDGELVNYVTKKLLKGLPLEFNVPDLGCSTFRAVTKEGDQIFGRNFDLTYAPAMLVKTTPDQGYASISMVNLSVLGYGEQKLPDSFMDRVISLAAPYAPFDGMNEKGLSIGVLLIPTEVTNQQTDKVDITTTTAIRLVLDKAGTVEEAIALLKQYDMHSSANSSYHFQIADASGNSAVVEYINNELSIVEQEGTFQAATNFLLTPGDYDFGKGQDRYETMVNKLTDTNGVLSQQEGMALLEAVSQPMKVKKEGEEPSGTQWSVIYNNTKKTMQVVVGRQYDVVHEFSLEEKK